MNIVSINMPVWHNSLMKMSPLLFRVRYYCISYWLWISCGDGETV